MVKKYPVFVMCGRDKKKRELIKILDPDNKYKVKPLLPFLGKRVIDWQLEEINKSPYVEDIYILGLSEEMAKFDFPVIYVPVDTLANFADKLIAGIKHLESLGKKADTFVISSSDTPGIKVESINEFFEKLNEIEGKTDFVLGVVPEDITEEEFPDAKRVVAKFRDHNVYPGELFTLSRYGIETGKKIIDEIGARRQKINRRKEGGELTVIMKMIFKKPRVWPIIIKYLLGLLKLKGGEKLVSILFNGVVKTIIIRDAGFGMDMDLPEDYERLRQYVMKTKNVSPPKNELIIKVK